MAHVAIAAEPSATPLELAAQQRFFSELVPDLMTEQEDKLLSGRALMQDVRTWMLHAYVPPADYAKCSTFTIEKQLNASFPMTDYQQATYRDALGDALMESKSVKANYLSDAPCLLIAFYSISPSEIPYILLLDLTVVVVDRDRFERSKKSTEDALHDAALWAIAVRRSHQLPPRPPKDPIADLLRPEFESLLPIVADNYLSLTQAPSILDSTKPVN